MHSFLDYIAIWLPILVGLLVFVCLATVFSRGVEGITRFQAFTRIFLSDGATLKTWGLFLSLFTFCLLLSGILAKLATDASWPKDASSAALRIRALYQMGLGLEVLLAICVGAFGAVAFKGQGPGGVSFQLNQDAAGNTTASSAAPAAPPVAKTGG